MRHLAPLLAVPAACLAFACTASAGTDLPRYSPGFPGHVGVAAALSSNQVEERAGSIPVTRATAAGT